MKTLSFDDCPREWAVCFLNDCPLASQCLRHDMGALAPSNLNTHVAVAPTARSGDTCRAFVDNTPVTVARGMTRLFDDMEPWQAVIMRREVETIFGSRRHYYRYREGRYEISPSQQQRVAAIFLKHGYTQPPHFDHEEVSYYFPNIASTASRHKGHTAK